MSPINIQFRLPEPETAKLLVQKGYPKLGALLCGLWLSPVPIALVILTLRIL